MKFFLLIILSINFLFSADTIANDDDEINHKLNLISKYIKVLNFVEKEYVNEIPYEDLINKSINGLMKELDSHSNFLKGDDYKDFKKDFNHYTGYGITTYYDKENKELIISEVLNNNLKNILERGNVIVSINEKNVKNLTKKEIFDELKKDNVDIKYLDNLQSQKNIILKKEILKDENILVKNDKNYLYILIRNFVPDIAKEVEKILKSETNKNKKLIIDLRNNSGGLFLESLNLTNLFLKKDDMMIKQKSRVDKYNQEFYANNLPIYKNNIIILVNSETASSSEIFSSIMKFYKKAIIVGEKTFGKGSVQTLVNLNEDNTEAIKITNSILYLPDDTTFHLKGVEADFVISDKVNKFDNTDNVLNYALKLIKIN